MKDYLMKGGSINQFDQKTRCAFTVFNKAVITLNKQRVIKFAYCNMSGSIRMNPGSRKNMTETAFRNTHKA